MRLLLHTGLLAAIGIGLTGSPVVADITTTINPASNRGSWEGWGVSLAWWGKIFGTRSDLADIFFTKNLVSYSGSTLPGLGLNIVRYNAGASSSNSINGTTMASNSILSSRKIDGYWIDWTSSSPSSSSWSWGVDTNQRNMMALAKARGVDRFELFSNSPMWWMCSNHNPAGASDGGENIQSWNIANHAVYLATIAKYAHDNWGITFTSVEPFNEPSSSWWKSTNNQEGSHFSIATQTQVISALRTELNNRGLSSTAVSASDENTYDLAVSTWNSFNSTIRGKIGRINVHGYQQTSGRRDLLYSAASAAGLKIWNSEYGDSDATGTQLAQSLLLDFSTLHPTAWTYWQAVDGSGWGLITGDVEAGSLSSATKKYFVLAQFTRHIREGMRILDSGNSAVAAAYDATNRKLVIVAANFNSGQYINFDLSKFSQPSTNGAAVARWSTHLTSSEQYASYSDTVMSGTKFWSYFDQNTVQTFEVNNVSL
ncbi:glycoside hydrolase family 30 protein [Hypholoma sublateritium FD-334 SS-4]|uniref:Glycoside hydrolase family 30 protein n=1 Tax=Hypholoma sublateritium (strain FD-334 SS-4) TaxID=945553 RepID=A0A0D2NUX3_HYPSF|nr:glycoside hydrolase family 30 protein [Hypholoma sublateritium FD-334 SS-4]